MNLSNNPLFVTLVGSATTVALTHEVNNPNPQSKQRQPILPQSNKGK